jgi:hypothetical protein
MAPAVLGAMTTIGLIAALAGDGIWDVIGWLALGTPPAVTFWFLLRSSASNLPRR